jgi:ribonuclease BN (tRNA processing enzyme)
VFLTNLNPGPLSYKSAASVNAKLHKIDPDRFSPLHHRDSQPELPRSVLPAGALVEVGRIGSTLQLSPVVKFSDGQPSSKLTDTELTAQDPPAASLALARVAKKYLARPQAVEYLAQEAEGIPHPDTEIITLGTGSAIPSKSRNVSATLVRVPGQGNYLFDCGENTLGQLKRMGNWNEDSDILANLRFIWISHMHADHHLGLLPLLKAIRVRRQHWMARHQDQGHLPKLMIMCPPAMRQYLYDSRSFDSLFTPDWTYITSPFEGLGKERREGYEDAVKGCGLQTIAYCRVQHCHDAFGVAVTWPNGLRIAYSGDCRPSDALVSIGQGATLLIHECTFDTDMQDHAIAKKHSTLDEALDVGRRMGAGRILLTHFSQRYPRMPNISKDYEQPDEKLNDNSAKIDVERKGKYADIDHDPSKGQDADQDSASGPEEFAKLLHPRKFPPTLFAWDYMRVRLRDFRKAEAFLPAIRKCFEVEAVQKEMEKEEEQAKALATAKAAAEKAQLAGAGAKKAAKMARRLALAQQARQKRTDGQETAGNRAAALGESRRSRSSSRVVAVNGERLEVDDEDIKDEGGQETRTEKEARATSSMAEVAAGQIQDGGADWTKQETSRKGKEVSVAGATSEMSAIEGKFSGDKDRQVPLQQLSKPSDVSAATEQEALSGKEQASWAVAAAKAAKEAKATQDAKVAEAAFDASSSRASPRRGSSSRSPRSGAQHISPPRGDSDAPTAVSPPAKREASPAVNAVPTSPKKPRRDWDGS